MRALFKRIHMLYKRIKELKILLSKSYMAYTPLRGVFTRDPLITWIQCKHNLIFIFIVGLILNREISFFIKVLNFKITISNFIKN